MNTAASDRENPPAPSARASDVAIDIRNLKKNYGTLEAVRGISFDVKRGEIFGLIGADGAGKTTTFQILAGVMEASGGSAEIFGKPAREARSRTGYLTQTFSLYPDLTVLENIRYIGDLRHVPPEEIGERGGRYLKMFDMDRFSGRLAAQLSGGMKQKLALVCALVSEPDVLLLDEPTTGVDPVSRREFWDTLAHLAGQGLTVLVATPYLDEAERCNRIALIHLGEIQQVGTPDDFRESLHAKRIELRSPDLRKALQAMGKVSGREGAIFDVQRFGDRLDLLSHSPDAARQKIEETMRREGIAIDSVRMDEPTLENTFVATLRSLGGEMHDTPFPARHDHKAKRGQVAIGAEHLTKQFGSFTAVHDVSLQVRYGEIYGLLGANGAGKTTTIKMLCGLLEASTGNMQLAGERGAFRSTDIRQQIGYMSQRFSLYDDLSIGENLDFFGGVYGVPSEELTEKERWVLDFSGLQGKEQLITGSLPGGWKQRVAFGSAIMHEPGIVFLDEPTSGVDPLARRAFWMMINHLADAGTAVLVTTHYLEEAEQCNRLGFMVAGELLVEGSPSEIKAQQKGHLLEFRVDQPQRAADLLKTETQHWRVALFGNRLHIITDNDVETGIREYTQRLSAGGIRVIDAREGRFSLEDVFISVVEKAREHGKIGSEE
ncbi:MAG TPA: ATP-binding cassette domain-containing protein [Candidatus Acidoferrales bacterium]|jgi:ABC-2 type transport system ATP-binding protein|nr:ATP-binding cassette domain-containing protein [Candidatus Acidoferrales bacterium]